MVEKKEEPSEKILKLSNERVSIEINPQGALLASLFIDGKEVVYKRRDGNPGRGGVPILGPTPGSVEGSLWENLYPKMPGHGTDRKIPWSVSKSTKNEVALKRVIGPNEFLFVGDETINIKLLEDGCSISKTIRNFEEKPREIGHGFHPYFAVSENTKYNPKKISELHPLTTGKSRIIKPGISRVEITIDNDSYSINAKPHPTQTVVWSDKPDLYECIEPWWAEKGKGDIIGPNESKTYTLEIRKIDPKK